MKNKERHKPGPVASPWGAGSFREDCQSVHKLRVQFHRSCKDCIYQEACFEYPERFIDLVFKLGEPEGCEALKRMAPIEVAEMRRRIKHLEKEVKRLLKEVKKYEEEKARSEAGGGIPEGSEEGGPEASQA